MVAEEEIQDELRRLGKKIGVKHQLYPSVCRSQGDGAPNIEISEDGTLSYEAHERGVQVFCYNFTNLDDLMYHTFKNIVPRIASDYVSEMEVTGEDFSQHYFSKTIELMREIKPEWGKRMEDEQKAT